MLRLFTIMKCGKVCRNPCKICLTPVTKKNGLQCQGACRAWVHFKCLHYTPGKIQDIKAGLIKVLCPCPNYETEDPKEILTNPPFSCTNSLCPVNLPLSCEAGGPTKNYPIPSFDYDSDSCPDCILPKYPPITNSPSILKSEETSFRCCSSESPSFTAPNQQEFKRRICSSNCSSKHRLDGNQQNTRPVSSDSQVPKGNSEEQKFLHSAIQNLCNTVCDLNTQLKDLMVKLEKSNTYINRQ